MKRATGRPDGCDADCVTAPDVRALNQCEAHRISLTRGSRDSVAASRFQRFQRLRILIRSESGTVDMLRGRAAGPALPPRHRNAVPVPGKGQRRVKLSESRSSRPARALRNPAAALARPDRDAREGGARTAIATRRLAPRDVALDTPAAWMRSSRLPSPPIAASGEILLGSRPRLMVLHRRSTSLHSSHESSSPRTTRWYPWCTPRQRFGIPAAPSSTMRHTCGRFVTGRSPESRSISTPQRQLQATASSSYPARSEAT